MTKENWLVLGSGISGLSAAKYLRHQGHNVTLYNQKEINKSLQKNLHDLGIIFTSDSVIVNQFTSVCPSPGIPLTHPILIAALEKNIPLVSEIQIALENYNGKIIAVTGTNGKSTTVSMIHHLFTSLKIESSLGGNIGIPPTTLLFERKMKDILILEISSYQLETTKNLSADAALITNFTEDHMARHKNLKDYLRCKWRIFENLKPNSLVLLDDTSRTSAENFKFQIPNSLYKLYPEDFDPRVFNGSTTKIKERHNLINSFFAVKIVQHFCEEPIENLIKMLHTYKGLSHRFERFINHSPFNIINDSKATNVDSTLVALESVGDKTTLFLGGEPKGESFFRICDYKKKISKIIAFGKAKKQIMNELSSDFTIDAFPSLQEAIHSLSAEYMRENTILFSPACASFDEFQNFEKRGDFFKKEVESIIEGLEIHKN